MSKTCVLAWGITLVEQLIGHLFFFFSSGKWSIFGSCVQSMYIRLETINRRNVLNLEAVS